jgi:hypothetical protein
MYRYVFTGTEPEDFPSPPIACRLFPGDEVEVDEPVDHARLELADEERASDTDPEPPAAAEEPPASDDNEE